MIRYQPTADLIDDPQGRYLSIEDVQAFLGMLRMAIDVNVETPVSIPLLKWWDDAVAREGL